MLMMRFPLTIFRIGALGREAFRAVPVAVASMRLSVTGVLKSSVSLKASCQACHPEGDVCLTCHSAKSGLRVNPHPKGFKADRIRSRSNNRSCRVCHDF